MITHAYPTYGVGSIDTHLAHGAHCPECGAQLIPDPQLEEMRSGTAYRLFLICSGEGCDFEVEI